MRTYKEAGVDIEAGEDLVRRIKSRVRSTFTRDVLTDIGAFGAFYRADFKGIRKPVLVSSVDGVGTKLKIAFALNRHHTVGQDLVNHCVNDILVCGAKPLFFLDYLATGSSHQSSPLKSLKGLSRRAKRMPARSLEGKPLKCLDFTLRGSMILLAQSLG
jgi:phosphoribosylformylglycinamidine cyclo-ligase